MALIDLHQSAGVSYLNFRQISLSILMKTNIL